jgi:hypothetical protein
MFHHMEHFESLQMQINTRLSELATRGRITADAAQKQINDYPWLYGALGKVPADVMFICENPSLAGIKKAHIDTIDGGPPDIEAQWWGGSKDYAAVRFRVALHQLGLKRTPPRERGGWECYITNVIKQANIAKDQEKLSPDEKRQQARNWSNILQWEIDQVKPKYIFGVGGSAFDAVRRLQREGFLGQFPIYQVTHYSARDTHENVINNFVSGVRTIMA